LKEKIVKVQWLEHSSRCTANSYDNGRRGQGNRKRKMEKRCAILTIFSITIQKYYSIEQEQCDIDMTLSK